MAPTACDPSTTNKAHTSLVRCRMAGRSNKVPSIQWRGAMLTAAVLEVMASRIRSFQRLPMFDAPSGRATIVIRQRCVFAQLRPGVVIAWKLILRQQYFTSGFGTELMSGIGHAIGAGGDEGDAIGVVAVDELGELFADLAGVGRRNQLL